MPVWLLSIVGTNFLLQVVASAARPLTSVRALGLGASDFELGLIAAAYASLALIVGVSVGKLIDRFGSQFFIVSGAAFMSLMMLATSFTYATYVLILIQAGRACLINANLGMRGTIATISRRRREPPRSVTTPPAPGSDSWSDRRSAVCWQVLPAEAVAGVRPWQKNFFFVLAGICSSAR